MQIELWTLRNWLRSLYNDLVATSIKEMSIDEQKTELEKLFQKYVDIPIIARAVFLGKSWRNANTYQRENLLMLLKTMFQLNMGDNFRNLKGLLLK